MRSDIREQIAMAAIKILLSAIVLLGAWLVNEEMKMTPGLRSDIIIIITPFLFWVLYKYFFTDK